MRRAYRGIRLVELAIRLRDAAQDRRDRILRRDVGGRVAADQQDRESDGIGIAAPASAPARHRRVAARTAARHGGRGSPSCAAVSSPQLAESDDDRAVRQAERPLHRGRLAKDHRPVREAPGYRPRLYRCERRPRAAGRCCRSGTDDGVAFVVADDDRKARIAQVAVHHPAPKAGRRAARYRLRAAGPEPGVRSAAVGYSTGSGSARNSAAPPATALGGDVDRRDVVPRSSSSRMAGWRRLVAARSPCSASRYQVARPAGGRTRRSLDRRLRWWRAAPRGLRPHRPR